MRTLACTVLLLGLVLPGAASGASTVSYSDERVRVEGDAGANAVSVGLAEASGSTFVVTIRDTTGVTVGEGCSATDSTTATCGLTVDGRNLTAALGDGDDAVTMLRESGGKRSRWFTAQVFGDAGNDHMVSQLRRFDPLGSGAQLIGGDGADLLEGGPGVDDLQGGAGEDILRGADGSDSLDGGRGIDRMHGGPGGDGLIARTDDAVIDLGDGNDELEIYYGETADTPVACGAGEDTVFYAVRRAPGVLMDVDCENAFEVDPQPVASTKSTITWRLRCYRYGRCNATLELRYRGRLIATQPFSSNKQRVPVTLELPRAAAKALRRDGGVLDLRIRGCLYDKDEFEGPTLRATCYWRTRVEGQEATGR